jgi:hypothetical protein
VAPPTLAAAVVHLTCASVAQPKPTVSSLPVAVVAVAVQAAKPLVLA